MNRDESARAAWAWPVLIGAVFAVSTGALFARLADPAPALAKAAWRCTLAAGVLFALGGRSTLRTLAATAPADRRRLAWAGLLLAIHFGTWILSLDYTTVTSSLVLFTTAPVWTALLAPWLLGEATSRRQWQGIALCSVGITVLAGFGAPGSGAEATASAPMLGNALALAGAISFSLFLIIGRGLQRRMPALPYLTGAYGGAALALIAGCLVLGLPLTGYDGDTWLWLVLLALVPQLIGHSGYNLALRHLAAATVSIMLVGEPIFGSLLAWLVLGEAPGAAEIAGGVLLLAGTLRAARG